MLRKLRAAVAQVPHLNGNIERNIDTVLQLIAEASLQNAQLILLPELFSSGFSFESDDMWRYAEPLASSKTMNMMTKASLEHNIVIAFTFLEVTKDGNYFNTFALIEPNGQCAYCRKSHPAGLEAYIFLGESCYVGSDHSNQSSHIIECKTLNCVVGVGICYENMLKCHIFHLLGSNATVPFDVLLMPHSAPTSLPTAYFPETEVKKFDSVISGAALRMAKLFGVPTLMANKTGQVCVPNPFPFNWMPIPEKHRFNGNSSICGFVKGGLGSSEIVTLMHAGGDSQRVVVTEIELPVTKKSRTQVIEDLSKAECHKSGYSRYVVNLAFPFELVWTFLMEPFGRLQYQLDKDKRQFYSHNIFERQLSDTVWTPLYTKRSGRAGVGVSCSLLLLGVGILIRRTMGDGVSCSTIE